MHMHMRMHTYACACIRAVAAAAGRYTGGDEQRDDAQRWRIWINEASDACLSKVDIHRKAQGRLLLPEQKLWVHRHSIPQQTGWACACVPAAAAFAAAPAAAPAAAAGRVADVPAADAPAACRGHHTGDCILKGCGNR